MSNGLLAHLLVPAVVVALLSAGSDATAAPTYRIISAKRGGSWSESVLHAFLGKPDGSEPMSGLTLSNGALYGTTIAGGRGACLLHGNLSYCGIVYEIDP